MILSLSVALTDGHLGEAEGVSVKGKALYTCVYFMSEEFVLSSSSSSLLLLSFTLIVFWCPFVHEYTLYCCGEMRRIDIKCLI